MGWQARNLFSLKNLPKELKSTGITAVTLWVASIVTMLFYVVKLLAE